MGNPESRQWNAFVEWWRILHMKAEKRTKKENAPINSPVQGTIQPAHLARAIQHKPLQK